MIGDAVQGKSIEPNTELSSPSSSGSYTIADGASAFIWSPAYPTSTTVYSGPWLLDLWASTSSGSDTLDVALVAVDSSNSISSIVVTGVTAPISASKSEIITQFSGSQVTVPAGGHLLAIITNTASVVNTFTIYWGSGQMTNIKTPSTFDYVLRIVNDGTSSYIISLSTYSSSDIGRLTGLTLYVNSPTTNCIVVTNGVLTQSSSTTITIPATSTLNIAVTSTANALGSSTFSLRLNFSPNPNMHPFTSETIDLTVN
jgi:hypothetical protein